RPVGQLRAARRRRLPTRRRPARVRLVPAADDPGGRPGGAGAHAHRRGRLRDGHRAAARAGRTDRQAARHHGPRPARRAAGLMGAALVYSWRYFEDAEAHFHALILLFLAGMTGFALSGDLFDMFVFFELMGAVAYALTGFRIEEPQAVQGALAFGVINSL